MNASPLGRYADDGAGQRLHEVRLLNLPVRLLADGRDRHDSLMREFALLAVTGSSRPQPPGLAELTEVLGVRHGAAGWRPDEVVDDALARGLAAIDVSYQVPGSVVESASRLEALMDDADAYCLTEQLLTLPRTPLQVRFERWYFDELRRQVGGAPPSPWDGPLDP